MTFSFAMVFPEKYLFADRQSSHSFIQNYIVPHHLLNFFLSFRLQIHAKS
jgi:hypothetical protein